MNRLGVIDWNGFTRPLAHRVKSPSHKPAFPLTPQFELKEIGFCIAQQLFILQEQRKWKGGIIAMDDSGNYWRGPEIQQWYRENTQQATHSETGVTYLAFDNSVREIQPDGSVSKSLAAAKVPANLDWKLVEEDHWPRLPTYKGNRKGKPWMLETPPEKYYKALTQWAYWFAGILGMKVVKIPTMEADDICAVAGSMSSENWNVDILTCDSDYHQLALYPGCTILDTGKGMITADKANDILKSLGSKILGGDTSDNIPGLPKGAKGNLARNTDKTGSADKLMYPFTGTTKAELGKYLLEMGDSPKMRRNFRLIGLPVNDITLVGQIKTAIQSTPISPKTEDWSRFELKENRISELKDKAMESEFESLFGGDIEV
jgi:5'-3' exonuclease